MTRSAEVLVHCRGAGRAHGSIQAVVGVTCSIRRGDRIAVAGRSGSGKSSLLYLLAGLERPTSGTVERSARCAVVFQGPSLHTDLDVVENVALGAVLADADESSASSRAVDALTAVGVADLAGDMPGTLSAGQAQRVAIARVLAARPDLILADEPTGHLDRAAADHVMGVLIRAADIIDAGLVVATHDETVAGRLRRRWSMTDGRLVQPPAVDDPRAAGDVRP